jgi:hypothetical protein
LFLVVDDFVVVVLLSFASSLHSLSRIPLATLLLPTTISCLAWLCCYRVLVCSTWHYCLLLCAITKHRPGSGIAPCISPTTPTTRHLYCCTIALVVVSGALLCTSCIWHLLARLVLVLVTSSTLQYMLLIASIRSELAATAVASRLK